MSTPNPISRQAYLNLKESKHKTDVHENTLLKKYDRIFKKAKQVNDIESMHRAVDVITVIMTNGTVSEFDSANAKLKKSLIRCEKYGGQYTLDEYDGSKFILSKDPHDSNEWILVNKRSGESFPTSYFKEF